MSHERATVIREWRRDGLVVSTDPARLDLPFVQRWLAEESYWARGIPLDVVERAAAGSINFGLYDEMAQVGYARVVTDRATFAWLADVFVVTGHRGRGLGVWLVECVMACPELLGLRNWILATADAHGLYRRFGFADPEPGRLMRKHDPDIYVGRG
jgi:GNAT superfamily N-acetyltransferase